MHTNNIYTFLALLVLLTPSVCLPQQEVLPYWEAEVFYDRGTPYDPNSLEKCREVVLPESGKYTEFAKYAFDDKSLFDKFYPDEAEVLLKLDDTMTICPGCQIPLMIQLSQSQNNQGFHHVESLCFIVQDGPDDLFIEGNQDYCLWFGTRYGQVITPDFELLKQLKKLRSLEIFGLSTKYFETEHLSNLKLLEYIGLPYDSNDAMLNHLLSLEQLEFINACSTGITGSNFEKLAKLPNLKILDLRYTRLCENAITNLRNIKTLKTLLLTGAKITDRHLEGIGELKGLQNLALSYTQITDATLRKIETLTNLRYLTLGGIPVTNQRIQSLRRSNPDLTISLDPIMSLEEYRRRNLYRKAILLGDVDAQIFFYRGYSMELDRRARHIKPKTEVHLKEYYRSTVKSEFLPEDRIELLKWIYVLLDPRKTPQEVERLERYLPRLNEKKETLEKEMYLHEKAESRRRAEMVLTLQNHYDISPAKHRYDHLPTYQISFPFVSDKN